MVEFIVCRLHPLFFCLRLNGHACKEFDNIYLISVLFVLNIFTGLACKRKKLQGNNG